MYIVVAVKDSDGNEAAWIIKVSLSDPKVSASSLSETKGIVTIIFPDHGEKKVYTFLDSPLEFIEGYMPTIILNGPVRYKVGGFEYTSNSTVALWINSEFYYIVTKWPEKHAIRVIPLWLYFVLYIWATSTPFLALNLATLDWERKE